MNFRCLKWAGVAIICALVAGCSTLAPRVINLTPQLMPTNPSGIYTMSLLVDAAGGSNNVAGANVVIGGDVHPMRLASGKTNVYTFDYSIPSNMNRARYYFETYDAKGGILSKSEIFDLRLTNRYVAELESSRAKPGASIAVLGKGFRDTDRIQFGGSTVETRFLSDNQLVFTVPAREAGEDYQLALETAGGVIPIGRFRIDFSELRAMPSRMVLRQGETVTFVFTIDQDAPPEGVALDIQAADSGMLEFEPVSIAGGERSIHAQFTGLVEGVSQLTVRAPAHNVVVIPVTVQGELVD